MFGLISSGKGPIHKFKLFVVFFSSEFDKSINSEAAFWNFFSPSYTHCPMNLSNKINKKKKIINLVSTNGHYDTDGALER